MKIEPELLTHPNIPKPLHGVNPRTIMGKEWWDKNRRIVYAERDFHCFACGGHKKEDKFHNWLECHEDYNINYKTGEVTLKRLVALCHCCHSFLHSGLLEMRLRKGDISDSDYDYIVKRGKKILKKAGLKQWTGEDVEDFADWGKWRLIIEDKEFYSKFKNYSEWEAHYRSI